ncbi:hypothetical protein VN0682_05770 [Helicobacter pylori]|nr:hypothetical protein VN0682_05770 [Helicobacter pylori]
MRLGGVVGSLKFLLDLVFGAGLQKVQHSFSLPYWLSLGLESMFADLGVVLAIPTLTGWLFSRSTLTARERFWVFILGAFSLASLVGMIHCGYGIITDFSALSVAM